MGNNTSRPGGGDPGIYANPQGSTNSAVPQPTQQQTNDAYNNYGLHHYKGNVQSAQQVNQTVAQQNQAKYGPFVGTIVNIVSAPNEVNSKLTAAAQNLKQGLDIRSAPPGPQAVYPGMTHAQLYTSVTEGVDPAAVGDVSETWLNIGNKLANLQTTVASSIASSQTTWTGNAAEQARQSIAKLGNQSGAAGQAAQLAGVLNGQQSEALTQAKNSIPPPPKNPYNAATAQQQLQTVTDPVAFAKQAAADQAQASAQQAAHQQAAHVVQQYDQTISQTSASMPAFAPAPPVAKPGGPGNPALPKLPGSGKGLGTGSPGSPSIPGTGPGTGSHNTGTTGTGSNGTGDGGGTFTPPNPPGGNQTTGTSGFTPPGTGTGGTGIPGSGYPGSTGFGGGQGGSGFGGAGGGTGGGAGGFGSGFGGGGMGGSGFGGSGGGAGGGSGSGFRSGSGGLGSSGGGTAADGSRSGAGVGGAAAEESAMGGARGATGTSGSSGMGGAPRGGGQRGQGDQEHKRPDWLLENDEGIFGTDELTAPPVIGE
jgi:hypothetical protein